MPFAVRVGFVILAHLFVLVKYFFKLFFEALSNFLSRTGLCCFVSFAATLVFYQSLSGLSSTFFIFLIPSPDRLDDSPTTCISQVPLFLHLLTNFCILSHSIYFVKHFFKEVCRTEKEGFEPSRRC